MKSLAQKLLVGMILSTAIVGAMRLGSAQSAAGGAPQSANGASHSDGASARRRHKSKLKPLYSNGQGCKFGAPHGGSGVLISTGFCPQSYQKQFAISGPALMIGNNAYYFGYHADAEARIVGDVFCQRSGAQFTGIAGGNVTTGGLNLNNFSYADSNFTIQPFSLQNAHDITLNILSAIDCQR